MYPAENLNICLATSREKVLIAWILMTFCKYQNSQTELGAGQLSHLLLSFSPLVSLRGTVPVVIVYHRYHHLFFSSLQCARKTPAICLEERKSSFLNLRLPSIFLAVLVIFDALAGSTFLPVCSPI